MVKQESLSNSIAANQDEESNGESVDLSPKSQPRGSQLLPIEEEKDHNDSQKRLGFSPAS